MTALRTRLVMTLALAPLALGLAACKQEAAAPGSEVVFSYFDQVFFEPSAVVSETAKALSAEVASVGEPFVSGFHPATLEEDLRPLGLRLLEDCSDADLVRRYDPANRNGFVAGERSRIAHVRVEAVPIR